MAFQKWVFAIALAGLFFGLQGCYTLKSYGPKEVKPEWEIIYAVKSDCTVVRFDDEDPATVQGKMIIGGVRNDFSELRPRRIPLDSLSILKVRRPDTSTRMLLVAGLGIGIAAFVVIEFVLQDRSKSQRDEPAAPTGNGGQ